MQNQWQNRMQEIIEKIRNTIFQKDKMLLCIVVGLLIFVICLPTGKNKTIVEQTKNTSEETQNTNFDVNQAFAKEQEKRLTQVLENMDGVGQVEVMITLKTSTVKVLAKEEPYQISKTVEEDGTGGRRTIEEESVQSSVVYDKNTDGEESPVIIQELQPEIEGVFIVAEGGEDKQIQMQINEAVQALFGIEAHKIKIVKRKV